MLIEAVQVHDGLLQGWSPARALYTLRVGLKSDRAVRRLSLSLKMFLHIDGERERPWSEKHRYSAFVDPSGGSSDSMTLAIGHREKEVTIVDVVREIPAPFDPESVVEEFAGVLKSYRITSVTGDRHAGQWCAQAFQKRGITYVHSELVKSALYVDLLPKLNSSTIRIPDYPRLVNQIAALERRTSRVAHCAVNRHTVTI